MIVDGLGLVRGRWSARPRVDGEPGGVRVGSRPARGTTCCRRRSIASAGARRRRDRLVGQERAAGARLPRRPGGHGADVPGDRRRRYAVPGDRARLGGDGEIELCGRDAVTIISGGEKIFAEEVEAAIKTHPAVYDCVVAGRPSDRWGNEVVAVVRRRQGSDVEAAQLLDAAASSPATSFRRRSCSSTPSSARRPARPTTAGRRSSLRTRSRSDGCTGCVGIRGPSHAPPGGREARRQCGDMFDAIARGTTSSTG